MADKLNITGGPYAKIERGETDPSITRLFEIAEILKTDVLSFIKEVSPATAKNENAANLTELPGIHTQLRALSKEVEKLKKEITGLKKIWGKEKITRAAMFQPRN